MLRRFVFRVIEPGFRVNLCGKVCGKPVAAFPESSDSIDGEALTQVSSTDGRGGGIRTHGHFVPNEARYQTALRPDIILEPAGRRAGEGRLQNFQWRASGYSATPTAEVIGRR